MPRDSDTRSDSNGERKDLDDEENGIEQEEIYRGNKEETVPHLMHPFLVLALISNMNFQFKCSITSAYQKLDFLETFTHIAILS